jgi:hypothetical protein
MTITDGHGRMTTDQNNARGGKCGILGPGVGTMTVTLNLTVVKISQTNANFGGVRDWEGSHADPQAFARQNNAKERQWIHPGAGWFGP